MTGTAESTKLGWPRWQQALLIALLVLVIGNRMTAVVDAAANRAGMFGELVYRGGTLIQDPNAPAGFGKMIEVPPDGPFARAGIRNGDFVRTDPSYLHLFRPVVGDRLNFTLDRDGVRSEHQIVIEPVPASDVRAENNTARLVNLLAALVSMLVGCFVLWRGWGNKTAMLLGAALAAVGRGGQALPPFASEPILAGPLWWLAILITAGSALLIPFAIRLFEQQAGSLPRWHWRLANIWFVWCLVSLAAYGSDRFWLTNSLAWAGGAGYPTLVISISMLVSIAYLVSGWRKSAPAERGRIALIIFALAAYVLAALPTSWEATQTGTLFGANVPPWLIYLNAAMQGVVAPGLLAYAVLRHKLFDLGFAVNRTLVFGAIGVLLLVSFALIEWAIKQAIPKVWYGGSVYISAVIAVGLYLTFNRLHHRVEHAIERVFFHKWQVNEAALKRFVAAAAHVEKPEALAGNFESELVRFSGGVDVAIYARSAKGTYASAKGKPIDPDDPALAAMRAEQGPVVPVELGSPIKAALALPMMHQAALAGFVLLGPKPTGEDYRPDEIEILAWATQQVGLDMQAIRVRELESTIETLKVTHQIGLDLQANRVRELELNAINLEARNQNLSEILAKAALKGAS